MLAVGSDNQFKGLCEVLEISDMAQRPEFCSNAARVAHRDALMLELNNASKDRTRDDLHQTLHKAKVPAGAVLNVVEALNQPEIAERYVVKEDGLPRLKTSAIAVGGH